MREAVGTINAGTPAVWLSDLFQPHDFAVDVTATIFVDPVGQWGDASAFKDAEMNKSVLTELGVQKAESSLGVPVDQAPSCRWVIFHHPTACPTEAATASALAAASMAS